MLCSYAVMPLYSYAGCGYVLARRTLFDDHSHSRSLATKLHSYANAAYVAASMVLDFLRCLSAPGEMTHYFGSLKTDHSLRTPFDSLHLILASSLSTCLLTRVFPSCSLVLLLAASNSVLLSA